MRLILGGHWGAAPAGWTAMSEKEQNITQRLRFNDGTVDTIFTEHVIEHITFLGAVGFMRESLRVLKTGGVFRCVAPMTHVFARPDARVLFMKRYASEQMSPYYKPEIAELSKLGLDLDTYVEPWIIDFLVRKHGHQFCWSGLLMAKVLQKVGFSATHVASPGESVFDQSSCIERRIRGTHAENLERDFGAGIVFDPESGVVEAMK